MAKLSAAARRKTTQRHRSMSLTARLATAGALFLSTVVMVEAQSPFEFISNTQAPCGGSLICYNGGTCQQGDASWPGAGDEEGLGGADGLPDSLPSNLEATNEEGYYCNCETQASQNRSSYTGLSCEIPYQECQYPNGFTVCYHGGTCLDEAPAKWDSGTPVCNCETAKHLGEVYVGRNCEVLSHEADPCEGQDSYCLNGGICTEQANDNEPYCSCPKGFEGDRCDIISKPTENANCHLECLNNGICRFDSAEHRNGGTPEWGTREFMFCECPTGFAGVQCEHTAEVCGNNEMVCLHGSTCQTKADGSGYECACTSGVYQGGFCTEHKRITHCNPASAIEFAFGMAVPAFCANGGECTEEVVDGLLMPGCNCPKYFDGPHCEFVVAESDPKPPESPFAPTTPTPPSKSTSTDDENTTGRMVVNLIMLVVFSVGTFFLVRQSIRIFRARQRQDQVVLNLQSFREENQGAVSANGSMLFPSMQNGSASQQRTGNFTMGELMHDVEIS